MMSQIGGLLPRLEQPFKAYLSVPTLSGLRPHLKGKLGGFPGARRKFVLALQSLLWKGQFHALFVLVMISGVIAFTRLIKPSKLFHLGKLKCAHSLEGYLLCMLIQQTDRKYVLRGRECLSKIQVQFWASDPTHTSFLHFVFHLSCLPVPVFSSLVLPSFLLYVSTAGNQLFR